MAQTTTELQLAVTELQRQVAQLQSVVDLYESRLDHVHRLLLGIGFPEGIVSLTEAIEDMIGPLDELDSEP